MMDKRRNLRASELIAELEKFKNEYGDLEVVAYIPLKDPTRYIPMSINTVRVLKRYNGTSFDTLGFGLTQRIDDDQEQKTTENHETKSQRTKLGNIFRSLFERTGRQHQ